LIKINEIWYYIKTGGVMINLVEDIRSISYVKAHTAEIMKQVGEKNNPMVITQNGEAKAVLMDVKQYQNIVDSINLLKILSIGENDIKNDRIYTHEELQKKINSLLD
jgi:prevent-host-death family protein